MCEDPGFNPRLAGSTVEPNGKSMGILKDKAALLHQHQGQPQSISPGTRIWDSALPEQEECGWAQERVQGTWKKPEVQLRPPLAALGTSRRKRRK